MKLYFKNLDALRTIACLSVIIQHSIGWVFGFLPISKNTIKVLELIQNGELGVRFFFVLSGFLITFLIIKEKENFGNLNLINFYRRRFLRIWPLYFFVLLFGFWVYPHIANYFHKTIDIPNRPLWCFLFLTNFDCIVPYDIVYNLKTVYKGIRITWSVAIEEQFYLFWPLLFIFRKKISLYFIISVIILSICFKFYYSNNITINYMHTFSNVFYLGIGGLVAYCCIFNNKMLTILQRLSKTVIVMVYIVCLIALAFAKDIFVSNNLKIVGEILSALFFAFVIVEQNFANNSFYKFGQLKLFSKIGVYSYGMYLLHPIVIQLTNDVLFLFGYVQNSIMFVAFKGIFIIITTILISMLSYHTFEMYFLKKKEKLSLIKKN